MENEALVEGHELTSQRQTKVRTNLAAVSTSPSDMTKIKCVKAGSRRSVGKQTCILPSGLSACLSVCLAVRLFDCLAVWYRQHPGNLIWHCDDITQTDRKRATGRKLYVREIYVLFLY